MKTLLWFGIIALVMIVIAIIANRTPSLDERKKEEGKSPKEAEGKTQKKAERKFFIPRWIINFLIVLIAGWILLPRIHIPGNYPVVASARDVRPQIGQTITVAIRPDCWSGWINLPPGRPFVINAPGEIEYLYWSGQRVFVEDKNIKWFESVEIPHCSFRLRGKEGEAVITVQ